MDSYLWLKLLHLLGAVVLIGTGAGIAFFMLMASRSDNRAAVHLTARHVVMADWLFTAPAVVVQLLSGLWLMKHLGYGFSSPWFLAVISLYLLIGCCWLPVVYYQYRLRALSAPNIGRPFPDRQFTVVMRRWTVLGIIAFGAILALLYLMIFKPLALQ